MEEKFILELLEKGKRIDNRAFDEFRPIEILKGIVKKAEGSARVRLGLTEVIAGVKIDLATPFKDTPDEGILIVNAEFTPLASPFFESGPPGEDAIELARVVDRAIRESKCIDMKKLVLVAGEKVFSVFIDIHIINHEGNLIDAAALASVAALTNTKIPKVENEETIIRGEYEKDLPLLYKPITITIGKLKDAFLVDPNLKEENVLEAKLSIGVRDDNKICAMQKQGKAFRYSEIEKIVELAIKKSEELRRLI
ncbi:MAG: exosome complex protein Rrp42 [Candidatus Aenigmatarchaeota archaeon]